MRLNDDIKKKPGILIVMTFILVIVVVFLYQKKERDRMHEIISQEYPSIGHLDEVDGLVTSIDHPLSRGRNDPLTAFITLNDTSKLFLSTGLEVNRSSKLDEILEVGDNLVKDSSSYFLVINKIKKGDTLKYYFELHDDLGYPLNKHK